MVLFVARPGLIIGKKGQEVEILQEELQNLTGRRVNLKIEEIGRPEIMAQLVAEDSAQQLAKRSSFRRTMKRAIETTMDAGAKGIKIQLAGRLGGSEMARSEQYRDGRVPLHTLRADIDFALATAHTTYGCIGVKCWIFHGEVLGNETTTEAAPAERQARLRPRQSAMGPGTGTGTGAATPPAASPTPTPAPVIAGS